MPRAGMLQGAMPGMSRLAQAVAQSGNAYDPGFDQELKSRSALAQAMAAARANEAKADQTEVETSLMANRPGMIEESVALRAGPDIDLPMVAAVRQQLRTGVMPNKPGFQYGPSQEDGTGPAQFPMVNAQQRSAIATQLSRMLPMYTNMKDTKPDDLANAEKLYGEQDLRDKILRGELKPGAVGAAQAAIGAKPLFNSDANGAVLDLFGGSLDTSNPMAQGTISLKKAQGKQAEAGAAENFAQAGAARALEKFRTTQAAGGGGGKAPTGYRYTTDPESGETKLEPIPGGPKDPNAQTGKPMPGSAAKALLENQQNLRRAQAALALVQGKTVDGATGDTNATGVKGVLPMTILNRVDPAGASTRAAIADLGSLVINDRSGAAVSASEFPRLAPFIPSATDDAATVQKKLKQFVKNYEDAVNESVDFFRASGYNVPAETLRGKKPEPASSGGFVYLGKEQ